MASKKPEKKGKQAPIPKKVEDTTEKDKRETMRTKILDAVDAAPKGRISLADLGRVTGTPVNGKDHEWDRMLEVLNVLESSGVLVSKIVKMTTVISRGSRDTKAEKKVAGKAKPARAFLSPSASKGTRKVLGAEDRAELAQSVDEAIASPVVAKKIKAAQTTKIAPSPEEALDKAIAKEIGAWKHWHSASALSCPSKVLPEEWAPGAVENATEEALYRLADEGKIRCGERPEGYVYAPRQMARDAPGGPEDPALPEDQALPQASANDVHSLPLGLLRVSPSNPRRRVGDLTELAASMKASGQLAPIVVRPHPHEAGAFEVVCGHRRSAAAQLAEIPELLVVVRHLSDREVLEAQLAENSQRVDVHPTEEADAIHTLHTRHKVPVEEIAAQLGRPVAFVHARLRLLRLAPAARTALEAGRVTLAVALELARLPQSSQDEALPRVLTPEGSALRTLADCRPILARYTLRLVESPFALDDATLPGGSCLRCPKRTGSQTALFLEAEGPDLCTDPACYQGKVAAQGDKATATSSPTTPATPPPARPKAAPQAPKPAPPTTATPAPVAPKAAPAIDLQDDVALLLADLLTLKQAAEYEESQEPEDAPIRLVYAARSKAFAEAMDLVLYRHGKAARLAREAAE
jgi:ParB/RepB/Spo0J family partition protein